MTDPVTDPTSFDLHVEQAEGEFARFRQHSIILNKVSWEIHDAMGLHPRGDVRDHGIIIAILAEACRLIRAAREAGL